MRRLKKVSSLFSPRSLIARTISNMSRITIMSSDTFMAIETRSRDRTCVVLCVVCCCVNRHRTKYVPTIRSNPEDPDLREKDAKIDKGLKIRFSLKQW